MDKTPIHTPGPWRSKPWSESEAQIIARVNGKDTLVTGYALPNDARLIAAAPELLAALIKAERILAQHGYKTDYAKSAIAKATQS